VIKNELIPADNKRFGEIGG